MSTRCRAKNPSACRVHGYAPIDVHAAAYSQKLFAAPAYEKSATVRVQHVIEVTRLKTVLANGTVETSNVAQPGDYIITNPAGEQYILKPDVFTKRYQATDDPEVFQASGKIRAIPNPTGKKIQLTAPWGEQQYGDADCFIAVTTENDKDRYIIGHAEFNDTYALVR